MTRTHLWRQTLRFIHVLEVRDQNCGETICHSWPRGVPNISFSDYMQEGEFQGLLDHGSCHQEGQEKRGGVEVSTGVRACFTLECTANKHTEIGVCSRKAGSQLVTREKCSAVFLFDSMK